MQEIVDEFLQFKKEPEKYFRYPVGLGECKAYIHYNDDFNNSYIGRGLKLRPFNHKNDLVSQIHENNKWHVEVINGLTLEQSKAVEAYFIKKGAETYGMTPVDCNYIIEGRLLNKRREHMQERLIPKQLF